MRCLITGVAGFVGSHLAETLLQDGHEVCGIDAFIDYYPRAIKERNLRNLLAWDRFSFREGNLLDIDLLALLDGVQWIFHQAAQAGVRASWEQQFDLYVQCNILATQRLLEAARHTESLRRFVYASSSSVYGNTKTLPVVESVPALSIFSVWSNKIERRGSVFSLLSQFQCPNGIAALFYRVRASSASRYGVSSLLQSCPGTLVDSGLWRWLSNP